MHRVEILLGTHNGAAFLSEQLDSIVNQSYADWKLVIHDDGSTDETVDIIKKYTALYPDKITFLDDALSFGNAPGNFAFLLEKATAEHVMLCDQDDVWLPDKIELTRNKMLEVEKSHPDLPILVHTDLKVVDQQLESLSDSFWSYQGIDPDYNTLNRLLIQNVVTGCTVMINKKLAILALPIPNDVIMHDWWLGLVASSFGEIHHIERATMLYRQHTNNDTGATRYNLQNVFKKAKELSDIDLKKYIDQAKELLDRYTTKLTPKQTRLLNDFTSIEKVSWLQSKQILLTNKILKQDLLRNIGLLVCR